MTTKIYHEYHIFTKKRTLQIFKTKLIQINYPRQHEEPTTVVSIYKLDTV